MLKRELLTHFHLNQLEVASPLDQFEIRDLISIDAPLLSNLHLSITNITLYLIISLFLIVSLIVCSDNFNKLVSNN